LLETRALVSTGVVSYSIFLWHQPLLRWFSAHGLLRADAAGCLTNVVLAAAVTGLLSAGTYLLVEAPALRRRVRGRAPAEEPVPVTQIEAAP
jgi:peptidoglycan/LPS O-acetylase OafA/YrhL